MLYRLLQSNIGDGKSQVHDGPKLHHAEGATSDGQLQDYIFLVIGPVVALISCNCDGYNGCSIDAHTEAETGCIELERKQPVEAELIFASS